MEQTGELSDSQESRAKSGTNGPDDTSLRSDQHFLSTLMDIVSFGVFFKDLDSRYTRTNRAFGEIVRQDPQWIVGKEAANLVAFEFAKRFRSTDVEVFAEKRTITQVERDIFEGRESLIEVIKAPVIDERGVLYGLVGIVNDITARVKAEEEARSSRQLLESILDNSPAMIHVKDLEGRYVLCNKRYEQLFHFSREELIGKTPYDLYPPKLAELYRQNDRAAIAAGRPIELEEEVQLDDGLHTYLSLKFPILDENGIAMFVAGISTDISARKMAEAAVIESEAHKTAILESSLDAIITMDHKGAINEFNPAAERIFGYKRKDMIKQDLVTTLFPHTDQIDDVAEATKSLLIGQRIETVARRIDGSTFPVEMAMTHVVVRGLPVYTVFLRDITRRKNAQEELQRQAQLLTKQAKELEGRNVDLTEAYSELKDAEVQLIHSEKMAAIGQLVAGLAHEINNPAAFVLTNLSVIARDLNDILEYQAICSELETLAKTAAPDLARRLYAFREEKGVDESVTEMQTLVESARKGMLRIRDLVANLRSYSRIDTRTEFEMADLKQGIQSTLMLLEPMIGKEVEVRLEAGNELPLVECNLGQVNQVIMNLIVNAVQAVGAKGLVVVSAGREDNGVSIKVEDNGGGIPEKIKSRIFDPFFTTKEPGKGTGLGLSISRRIIESHGGKLEFTSESGKGTQFRIWIPLRQPKKVQEVVEDSGEIELP